MDINGGQYPNQNGSPIFPGTAFQGPIIAGNVQHSDGSGKLAGIGESNGIANAGYVQMVQTQAGIAFSGATTVTTNLVIPAQSQITDIYATVTTAQAAGAIGVGTTAGGATALTAAGAGSLAAIGQLSSTLVPSTATQVGNWDNVGSTDVQLTVTANATGAGVITLTVFYVQGINNAS